MDLKKLMGWTIATALVLGVPALTAALDISSADTAGSASSGAGIQEEQGMQPTATGSSGTSPDSTSQTGRGSDMGGMGTRGGTQEMDSDTMRKGMRFHSATGMSNMTGSMGGGMMHPGGGDMGGSSGSGTGGY